MHIYLTSLPVLSYLLCLFLPGAALASDGTDISAKTDHERELVDGSGVYETAEADSWASLSPPYLVQELQNAVQPFVSPESSLSDIWEEAKKYEDTLQDYVPRMLESAAEDLKSTKFTDLTSTMYDILRATATFRSNVQDALDARRITFDAFVEELDAIFTTIKGDLEKIPRPEKTSGHSEREEMVNKILDMIEEALVKLATRLSVDTEIVRSYFRALRPHLHRLIIVVGDINEQYPQLTSMIMFAVVGMLIPQSWILGRLLSLFGFGPLGPLKGSFAAWLQRFFFGGAVKAGSWFAFLQAAGMGQIPQWAWLAVKVPLTIGGGLLGMLFSYFNHTA